MPLKSSIGNDIVDLCDPLAQSKENNLAFLARVFSSEEQRLISKSIAPHVMLWTLWSIKEASLKAAKKLLSNINFIPKKFSCEIIEAKRARWRCYYNSACFNVHVTTTSDYVHAVAVSNDVFFISTVLAEKSEENASNTVRVLALRLLAELGVLADAIRHKPPRFYRNETEVENWDVSLSHDGRFIAAAVLNTRL